MTIARMTLGEWVLRLLIAVTPALAALCTIGAGEGPPVYLVVLLLLLGAGFAAFPESAVGLVVIVLVLAWWGLGLRDGLDPWALPAAALLLAGHVAALLVSYGPGELELDPTRGPAVGRARPAGVPGQPRVLRRGGLAAGRARTAPGCGRPD